MLRGKELTSWWISSGDWYCMIFIQPFWFYCFRVKLMLLSGIQPALCWLLALMILLQRWSRHLRMLFFWTSYQHYIFALLPWVSWPRLHWHISVSVVQNSLFYGFLFIVVFLNGLKTQVSFNTDMEYEAGQIFAWFEGTC